MLVEEYRSLTYCKMPPLLTTMEVDVLRISSRLLLLKSLKSEHSLAMTNMMHNSHDIKEIVEFFEQQHYVFREFAKQVESGDYDF
jgi:HJR/Mrr/RecB family endonuclease